MIIVLVVLHVLVALFLIGVVLLQQGSADLAAAFGGQGPQTSTSLSVGMTLLK